MKRRPTEWEDIFTNDIYDPGIDIRNIWRTPKIQQKQEKTTQTRTKDMNRHVSKSIRIANKDMKRCSTLLIITNQWNLSFLHCRQTLYHLSYQGSSTNHSVQFSRSVVSDPLRPHELQHARPPCPSTTPRVHPNSCPLSR